jgi:hypothetical protein
LGRRRKKKKKEEEDVRRTVDKNPIGIGMEITEEERIQSGTTLSIEGVTEGEREPYRTDRRTSPQMLN